jgi:hypothetical protein
LIRATASISARAGYLVYDKTLVFLRGGYANLRVRTTLSSEDRTLQASDNLDGWQVGGGVERASPTISAHESNTATAISAMTVANGINTRRWSA